MVFTGDLGALYHLVVCRATKLSTCAEQENDASTPGENYDCKVTKNIDATTKCNFAPDLWAAGGTCIDNILNDVHPPNCPPNSELESLIPDVKRECQVIAKNETNSEALCTEIAMSF